MSARTILGPIAIAMLALSFAVVALAGAPAPPPPAATDAVTVSPTTPKDLVRSLRLGSFTAHFEQTPLQEIATKLGGGAIGDAGDASTSRRWLCYSLPGQLLWLVSTPMGGTGAHLMEVVAESVAASDPRAQSCRAVPESRRPVSLEFGWVGTREVELHQKLGQPSGYRGAWQLFFFHGKTKGQAPGSTAPSLVEYEVIAYVEAKVENGSVVALRASHVTSY